MSQVDRMQRLDRIKRAIDEESDVLLTESERNEKTELLACVSMLLNPYNSMFSIIATLKHEHDLSERQAWRRIADAKFVFGNVFMPDKALERMKAYQRAEEALQLARDRGNVDGILKANEQLMKIVGTDDPNDMIDPTKLEPSYYKAVLPAAERKMLTALAASGSVDISALMLKAGLITDAVILSDDEEEAEVP